LLELIWLTKNTADVFSREKHCWLVDWLTDLTDKAMLLPVGVRCTITDLCRLICRAATSV
jgi:hypothetical protein